MQQLREASELLPVRLTPTVRGDSLSLVFNVSAGAGGGTAAPGEPQGSPGAAMLIEFKPTLSSVSAEKDTSKEAAAGLEEARRELEEARRAVERAAAKLDAL